ncbi:hypothetical protein RJ639_034862 [Escallonia herrerae]|uniref:Pentatricopeptide repeat-containing protein n=1 Tax=Escallonia herrerae TaxID=1293975 RepID=A0AA88WMU5_9ASTE|nr:hypothetical protein RJ639_034862 [Escallonia herrerae]
MEEPNMRNCSIHITIDQALLHRVQMVVELDELEDGEVGEDCGGRAGAGPEDGFEAAATGDDRLEDGACEARVAGPEGEEGGSEGLELGEEEVVGGGVRQELRVSVLHLVVLVVVVGGVRLSRRVSEAVKVFDELENSNSKADIISYNSLINCLGKNGDLDEAHMRFKKM